MIDFKTLVSSYHRRLFRFALHYLGNVNDAEDAVQDAYLKLWNQRENLEKVENLESYCLATVRRVCLDRLRANRLDTSTDVDDPTAMGIPAISTDAAIDARDEVALLHQVIDTLPQAQRTAITMRDLDDCSMEDIERATGYSAVNIRSLLCRGRKTIREQLNKVIGYEH